MKHDYNAAELQDSSTRQLLSRVDVDPATLKSFCEKSAGVLCHEAPAQGKAK